MKNVAAIAYVGLGVLGAVLLGAVVDHPHGAAFVSNDQASEPEGEAPQRYTKEQFAAATFGKTKPEIRAMLGSPTQVISHDEWDYYTHAMANPPYVYDAEAGTEVLDIRIRFYPASIIEAFGQKCDGGADECAAEPAFD